MARPFTHPHVQKFDEKLGYATVDEKESEEYRLLEAYGTPMVFYAVKANQYFKDNKATIPFTDTEIKKLGLPIPAEIQNERNKFLKEANEALQPLDVKAMYAATCPQFVDYPERIKARLNKSNSEDRMIARINQANKLG